MIIAAANATAVSEFTESGCSGDLVATAAAKWTHTMSAVPGGFEWIQAHGKVGGLPTLDFPEYSMFSGCPWGGYGANPVPQAMQSDWNSHGGMISGGMPYSEGI